MGRFYYVSHPEVAVDPDVPVPQWGLSEIGRRRAEAATQQPWAAALTPVGCSPETKAREAAGVLALRSGADVEVIDNSHEVDRSSTGFVSHERHEALADRLFAEPAASAEGWETAVAAQDRMVATFGPLLVPGGPAAQVVVGHGGVGTLLLCHLLGVDIDRSHDQPGQGYYWVFDCDQQRVLHQWQPIDRIEPTIASESPSTPDVVQLLETHLDFSRGESPPEHVHALDLTGLTTPDIMFCTARRDGVLMGVGALRDLGDGRAEIKSMHTAAAARGEGVGRALLQHLIDVSRSRNDRWLGLETGTMESFAPARALYASAGFTTAEPFADYSNNEFSTCMELRLR